MDHGTDLVRLATYDAVGMLVINNYHNSLPCPQQTDIADDCEAQTHPPLDHKQHLIYQSHNANWQNG